MCTRALLKSLPKFEMAGRQSKLLSMKFSVIAKQGIVTIILKLDMKAQAIGVQQVHFSMAHYGGTCWTVSVCSRKAAVLSQPRSGLDWQSALRAPGAEICLLSAWLPFLFLISPLPPPFGLLDFPGDLIVVGELLSSVISDFRSCSCPRSSLTPTQYL